MLTGTCHCGAVSYQFTETPKHALSCNCSVCRRLGVTWIYAEASNVTLTHPKDGLIRYAWGDKNIVFNTCKSCGCTTHWVASEDPQSSRMAVNLALCDDAAAADIPVRRFDGADTWTFLD